MSGSLRYPLVTGAGGFIGRNLVAKLASREETSAVIAIDRPNSPGLRQFRSHPKVLIEELDIAKGNFTLTSKINPTCIFMLAALNGTGRFYSQPWDVLLNSTLPTLNVISKFENQCPILYSSSSEVYASTVTRFPYLIPTKEDITLSIDDIHNPRWSYAAAKILGEIAMQSAAVQIGMSGVIVRYHNVYGEGMGNDHFVPEFINKCKSGNFDLIGANETRAFMHVDDASEGTILAIQHASQAIPIFHLGSEEEITILEAAEIIVEELGLTKKDFNLLPSRKGSVMRRLADIGNAKDKLNWYPKVKFREGIRRTIGHGAH